MALWCLCPGHVFFIFFFFFTSRRRHTRSLRDWSSDVCSSDLRPVARLEFDDDVASSAPTNAGAPPDGGDVADAGPSYDQLALLGIPEAHALGYHGEGVLIGILDSRSEERRVGKECRSRRPPCR